MPTKVKEFRNTNEKNTVHNAFAVGNLRTLSCCLVGLLGYILKDRGREYL